MTDRDKLRHLLKHWIEHNEAHVSTYKEWAVKAGSLGEEELSDILKQITRESGNLNGLFQKALECIEKRSR